MHTSRSRRLLPTAALALATMACGAPARTTNVAPEPAPADHTPPVSATVAIDSAAHPWSEADVEFMAGMIHHHAQAIVMSEWAPTHGASESIRTLAGRIINAQRDEIRLMEQWLRDRGEDVPEPMPTGGGMMDHMQGAGHETMMMPGMLSPEQMQQLDSARGKAFDELFLTFMIQHHRGAITMVKELFNTYGAVQDNSVFKLASDVNVDQTTEVARMTRMLFALKLEAASP